MANRNINMRNILEVFRLFESGFNKSQIEKAVGISRKTIIAYLSAGERANITFKDLCNLSTEEIYLKLFPESQLTKFDKNKIQPDWDFIHCEMQKKNVTLQLLWEEFNSQNIGGVGYSSFCTYYRNHLQTLDVTMRQNHKLGEKAFVDYAGHTIAIINQFTGEVKYAQIFVCVLGASNFTFCCATWTQSLPDWIDSHIKAFEYFGGVPEIVVIDNLKSGITKPCRYDPEINKTYHDLAMHYGVAVIPIGVNLRVKNNTTKY